MKTARLLIAIFIVFMGIIPAFAEGYNVLVIPYCAIDTSRRNTMGNVDIEEMLARKFISKMDKDGMANAPTMNVLKISIKNNPKVVPNSSEPMSNVRAIAKAYGVSKVLLIMSKTELQNASQQKNFWNKLDLPVITQSEANVKLVTTVTMYDAKEDEIMWNDVYYKKMNLIGEGNYESNKSKLAYINEYYDDLIPKVLMNIRDSKETHAIMLTSEPQDVESEKKYEKENFLVAFWENLKNIFSQRQAAKEREKQAKLAAKREQKKIKPDLNMKENFKEEERPSTLLTRFKDTFQFKFYVVKQDFKIKNIMKEFEDTSKPKADPTQKAVQKVIEEKQKQTAKQLQKEQKTAEKEIKKAAKTAEKKAEKKVVKKEVKTKEDSLPLKEVIKSKYQEYKLKYATKPTQEDKSVVKGYTNMMLPDREDTSSANIYLQTKPRYNSKNYVPKFNASVNDM